MPKVIIFAGANGTGKTTLSNTVIEHKDRLINADQIMDIQGLSPLEAGKEALRLIDKNISKKMNFSFETTMAGLGFLKRFEKMRKKNYRIIIFYLFNYSTELLIERIKERVKKGGHHVKDIDVVRRHYRSVKNFWNVYRFFADEWSITSNDEFKYENVVTGSKDKAYVIDSIKYSKFREVLQYGKT